jgi:choline dehydrogenase
VIATFGIHLPVAIRFGEGVVGALPEVLEVHGAVRPVAVVEEPVAALPAVAAALRGCATIVKPAGEPTVETIDAIAAELAARGADAVVAIGGGSALDAAKGARAAYGRHVGFGRLLSGEVAPAAPAIPLVTVPTTAGTGSEVSGGVVVTRAGRKAGVASPLLRAQHALVDPALTTGLPRDATMQTGADALAQAIGGVTVRNGSPASRAVGLEACRHVARGYARAVADGGDAEARSEMMLASLLAGLAMNLSDCGADHALGHALGARLSLPHGLAVGLALPAALEVSRPDCVDGLELVADALGEPPDGSADGSRSVRAVRRLLDEVGFPAPADCGFAPGHVDAVVADALADYCITVDAHEWTEADVRAALDYAVTRTRPASTATR